RRHTSFSRDWSSDVCSSDLRLDLGFSAYLDKVVDRIAELDGVARCYRAAVVEPARILKRGGRDWPLVLVTDLGGAVDISGDIWRSEERRVGKGGSAAGAGGD